MVILKDSNTGRKLTRTKINIMLDIYQLLWWVIFLSCFQLEWEDPHSKSSKKFQPIIELKPYENEHLFYTRKDVHDMVNNTGHSA